jgi:hypothetical protein
MAAAEAAQARAEQRATSAVTSAQAEHVTARGASQRLTAALALCSRLHAAARCATATAATAPATSSSADDSQHTDTATAAVATESSGGVSAASDSTIAVEELMRLVYSEVPPLLSTQPTATGITGAATEQPGTLTAKPVSPRPRTPTKASTHNSSNSSSTSSFSSSFNSTLHHPAVQALLFVADSAAQSAWSRHSSSTTTNNSSTNTSATTAGDSVEVRVSLQEGPLARAARTGRILVMSSTKQQHQQQSSDTTAIANGGADVTADVTGDVACQLPPDCDAAVYVPLRAPVFAAFAQLASSTANTSTSTNSSRSNTVTGNSKGVLGVLRVLKLKGAGGCTASEVQALQAVGDAAGAALYAVLARKQLDAHNYSEQSSASHQAGQLTLQLYIQVICVVIFTYSYAFDSLASHSVERA